MDIWKSCTRIWTIHSTRDTRYLRYFTAWSTDKIERERDREIVKYRYITV